MKKRNIILEVVPEPVQPGTRYFTRIRFLICRIKSLFRKPKPFDITKIDQNNLNLFQEFVIHYSWTKQTMILQERIPKKSTTCEASIVVEYQWFNLLSPEQKFYLSKYGYREVVKELQSFIEKWEYKPLKRRSHKTVNYIPDFLKLKS